jgi:hypothetical protein
MRSQAIATFSFFKGENHAFFSLQKGENLLSPASIVLYTLEDLERDRETAQQLGL